ncbi:MAG TPA: tRNA (guanosine(37)-N1)-methyltransferase TrmD [Candidatus Paceibacterota bacterium]|nr:tRNA (guanosine(37)-N1)-methyltransferase TrmD [Candidatus Paceibacterota bacterium]
MVFHIITIFPESFESYLNSSMLWRAQKEKKVKFKFYNPRNYTKDKHRKVDGRPYGGGPGMVLQVEPILLAVKAAQKNIARSVKPARFVKTPNLKSKSFNLTSKIIVTGPAGKQFDNGVADQWSRKLGHLIIICGHYEGIDARVKKILRAEEISIGPYVLTGGELPALVMMDAVARRIPGVLGNEVSLEEKRIAASEVYTRPEVYKHGDKNYSAPKVLLSGHHKKMEEWRKTRAKR